MGWLGLGNLLRVNRACLKKQPQIQYLTLSRLFDLSIFWCLLLEFNKRSVIEQSVCGSYICLIPEIP